MILALMIPAAALADIPIIPMDDPTVNPTIIPVPVVTAVPQPTANPLPTYNPWQTGYVWPTALTYAVRLFQMDWNKYNPGLPALAVDGKVGPSTRKVLFGSSAEPAVTAPANTFTLEKGMKGEEVLTAQKRLAQLGYYLGELNGEFNDSMVYAVKLMQQKNEITVDGKIGYNTRMLMYSSSVIPADYPDYNIGTMSIGMTGENVKELQRQLRNTFYYSGTIDGIFGTAVQNAVKAFQASAGLSVDGKVGPRTFDALYNRTADIFNGGIPSRELSKGSRGWDVKVLQEVMGHATSILTTHEASLNPIIRTLKDSDTNLNLKGDTVRYTLKPHKTFLFKRGGNEERIRFEVK